MSHFWSEASDKHKKIARTFYNNIEYDHPDYVTSDRLTSHFLHWGTWNRTSVKYYSYNGPDVKNI